MAHVWDTTQMRRASGVDVEMQRRQGKTWQCVARVVTDADGRCDAPLLLAAGGYLLLFNVGACSRSAGGLTEAAPFLDVIPIRFALAPDDENYYELLVLTPWSYSTCRGN